MNANLRTDRSSRVAILLIVFTALSFLDLGLTVGCMSTGGMFEVNPIARALMEVTQSSFALALLKIASLAIVVGVLFPLRKRLSAELVSWGAAAAVVFVTIQWVLYLDVVQGLEFDRINVFDPQWMAVS